MTKNLSIFNQLRPITIGFDNIFDHFENMFDGDVMTIPQVNYPPYNIVRTGDNTYDIELALAGFSKEDNAFEPVGAHPRPIPGHRLREESRCQGAGKGAFSWREPSRTPNKVQSQARSSGIKLPPNWLSCL